MRGFDWMKLRAWAQAMTRQAAVVPALGVLLVAGILAASAAPGQGQTSTSGGVTTSDRAIGQQSHTLVAAGSTPTDTPAATPVPTATDTPTAAPQPTATATQAPAATPTPTAVPPTPTATPIPAPAWHTVGSYSGSTAQQFATLTNVPGAIRVDWTCQTTQALPSWGFTLGIAATTKSAGAGQGGTCDASHLSAAFTFDQPASSPGNTWTVTVGAGSGGAVGPWTATVEEWY